MPIKIGLLPFQQESFEHHEELSKLSNETEVFYVPLYQDLSDLTKRFDEDILNKHLVVTFRDIGYSLFLDSVKSSPDQTDQSKVRISGKMIVDGICIQFLGCFDCDQAAHEHAEVQQINGVGRVRLDEDYYRELASTQILIGNESFDQKYDEGQGRHTHMVARDRPTPKTKRRSRTISENILGKMQSHLLISPPSSVSTSRSRLHSPNHMPYPLRSPRTLNTAAKQQYQASSPVNIDGASASRSSGFHSSFISPSSSVTSSCNENPIESSQQQHPGFFSHSSPQRTSTTMPIQIQTSTVSALSPPSLPQLTGLFSMTQSHSLPTYFLPHTNLAYLTAGSPGANANVYLITNPIGPSMQPLRLLTPIDTSSSQFGRSYYSPSCTGNQISPTYSNESISFVPNKRQDLHKVSQAQAMDTTKPFEEQLPFKKRRHAGQPSAAPLPMDMSHHDDNDDEESNDSIKK